MPYEKKNRTFSLFKKTYQEKQKKTIFVHRGLTYADKKLKFACKNFFGNCLFEYKSSI